MDGQVKGSSTISGILLKKHALIENFKKEVNLNLEVEIIWARISNDIH